MENLIKSFPFKIIYHPTLFKIAEYRLLHYMCDLTTDSEMLHMQQPGAVPCTGCTCTRSGYVIYTDLYLYLQVIIVHLSVIQPPTAFQLHWSTCSGGMYIFIWFRQAFQIKKVQILGHWAKLPYPTPPIRVLGHGKFGTS